MNEMTGRRKKFILVLLFLILCGMSGTFLLWQHRHRMERQVIPRFENREEIVVFIRECLQKHSKQIRIRFPIHGDSMQQIEKLVHELMEEALAETSDPTQGDYLRFQYGGYDLHFGYEQNKGKNDYLIQIMPTYYTYPVQEDEVSEKIEKIMSTFDFSEDTPEEEKVQKIYDYVYSHVSYDRIHKKNKNNHLKSTAYSALIYRTAVCQGYCVLLYRLLKEAGISNRIVTGTAALEGENERHAWNIVRIGEVYYNLDVTWDKALATDLYYMKSDGEFSEHVRDEIYQAREFYEQYPMAEKSL